MIYEDGIKVIVADASHEKYVDLVLDTIREAAKKRGTGIAERTHEYVATKMKEGKAVLALDPSKQSELGDTFVGFSYIETWGNKSYVTTSGLIVHPDYQGRNIAKRIKDHAHQGPHVHFSTGALASCEDFLAHKWRCGDEDEHRIGLCACEFQSVDG